MKKGDRVGAVMKATKTVFNLYGYGVYVGDEVPPNGWMAKAKIPNPKIELDNGTVIWGYECWWGSEECVKESIGDRKVVIVEKLK